VFGSGVTELLERGSPVASESASSNPQPRLGLRRIVRIGAKPAESDVRLRVDRGDASVRIRKALRSHAIGLLGILALTVVFRRLPAANETTVGFAFLLAVLFAAALSGFGTSLLMAVAATLVYDYYFIPPINTWNITDSRDWIALSAFVITSTIGSTLSATVRRQAQRAQRERREAEQLYALSQRLLSAANVVALCRRIPSDIVDTFTARAAALFLSEGQTIFVSPEGSRLLDLARLKSALLHEDIQAEPNQGCYFVPLNMGSHALGSVGIAGAMLLDTTLESLGSLIAIAIERARAIEQLGRIETLRENERLKSALLDAITHEFRTPLTAMKVSVTGMLSDLHFDRAQCRELLAMIDEGCDRLDQLIGQVSEMSRLESGEAKIHLARHSVEELIEAALSESKAALGARQVEYGVANREVAISVDLIWAAKVLSHLIANAALYSTPGKPITIRTETRQGHVVFSVADRGPGIDQSELRQIFEKFYRGKDHRFRVQGTGMGLPISKAIVEAHGGSISATSKVGEGSVFSFTLPIDRSSDTGQ
jgi:two-component system, OmpR family, sensor histidine kinase KdpD